MHSHLRARAQCPFSAHTVCVGGTFYECERSLAARADVYMYVSSNIILPLRAHWPQVCFIAIIPLEKMFDWGGEQMALYLGKDLGDLLIITLNK